MLNDKKEMVAIVLASYNGQLYIKEQVLSILNQSYQYIKINGSRWFYRSDA